MKSLKITKKSAQLIFKLLNRILFFFIIFSSLDAAVSSINELKELSICKGNKINNYNLFKNTKVQELEIKILKNKKWVTNLLRAYKDTTQSSIRQINEKFKKNFNSKIKVIFNNGLSCEFNAKVSLAGMQKDHLGLDNNQIVSSLNVTLLDGHINSIRKFKLFLPIARFNENEVFITHLMKSLNFIAPETYFLKVKINGNSHQFIFQEKLSKEMLEKQKYREGPLLKGYWNENNKLSVRLINKKWSVKKRENLQISLAALNKLTNAYEATLDQSNSIDLESLKQNIEKISAFDAILFTLGTHGIDLKNRLFYYNIISGQFHPVYYDGDIYNPGIEVFLKDNLRKNLSANSVFMGGVNLAIKKIKNLDKKKLFEEINQDKEIISLNKFNAFINQITEGLNEIKEFDYEKEKKMNKHIKFIKSTATNDIAGFFEIENNVLKLCNLKTNICTDHKLNKEDVQKLISQNLKINNTEISLQGTDFLYYNKYLKNKTDKPFANFKKIDFENSKIFYNDGITLIKNDAEKKLEFMQKNSEGRVLIFGGSIQDWNIHFFGLKKNYLNSPLYIDNNILLTGCLTFYAAKFKDASINVDHARCEDGINIINSTGNIKKISSSNSVSDGIDIDFSEIDVEQIKIIDSGNDCIDFSAGSYSIQNIYVENCSDKGVSVGEKSNITINKLIVNNSNIGLAAKDSSIVKIIDGSFHKNIFCLAAYRKKIEFDGAKAIIKKSNCNNERLYSQKGSEIINEF